VLRTSDHELDAEEIASAYQQLRRIERSFRSLKSLQNIVPMYHWRDRRIRAHVTVCVLAHLLERVLERKLEQGRLEMTGVEALRELGRLKVAEISVNDRRWLIRSEASDKVKALFDALHYRLPSRAVPLGEVVVTSRFAKGTLVATGVEAKPG